VSSLRVAQDSSKSKELQQINKVVTHPTIEIAITGTEDGNIGVYDLSSSKY
jgi:hypothetical protein